MPRNASTNAASALNVMISCFDLATAKPTPQRNVQRQFRRDGPSRVLRSITARVKGKERRRSHLHSGSVPGVRREPGSQPRPQSRGVAPQVFRQRLGRGSARCLTPPWLRESQSEGEGASPVRGNLDWLPDSRISAHTEQRRSPAAQSALRISVWRGKIVVAAMRSVSVAACGWNEEKRSLHKRRKRIYS
jgi:hypothetical protein